MIESPNNSNKKGYLLLVNLLTLMFIPYPIRWTGEVHIRRLFVPSIAFAAGRYYITTTLTAASCDHAHP